MTPGSRSIISVGPGRYARHVAELDDLSLALTLADLADEISMARFLAADLRVESKPDLTPVSDADTAVERRLRAILSEHRPGDAIVGEEYGEQASASETGRRWVIDPIDGTKNYVRGVPVWATLIGLLDGDDVIVGVVSAPALSRRWWAARGSGAYASFAGGTPRRLSVSGVRSLGDASLAFSDLAEWETAGRLDAFLALSRSCWRVRGYGDFYPYMMVAEGSVDLAAEPDLNLWDIAALVPIVLEAGGTLTGIDGSTPAISAGSALATNGLLHGAAASAIALT